jgi:hypothetical protein
MFADLRVKATASAKATAVSGRFAFGFTPALGRAVLGSGGQCNSKGSKGNHATATEMQVPSG